MYAKAALIGETQLSWVTAVWMSIVTAKLTVCSLPGLDRNILDLI